MAAIDNLIQLATKDIVQHLIQSGITASWTQLNSVTGFVRSYLHDWAQHHEITLSMELGRLFTSLYLNGIGHQDDHQFIEDAAAGEEMWGESRDTEGPMDEDEYADVPPLELVTPPNPLPGSLRPITPDDEKVDWGEDEL